MFNYAIREGLIDPERAIQIGIRTTYAGEKSYGMKVLFADQVHAASAEAVAAAILGGQRAVYLTFDIDCLTACAGNRHAGAGRALLLSGAGDSPGRSRGGSRRHGCGRGVAALRSCRDDRQCRRHGARAPLPQGMGGGGEAGGNARSKQDPVAALLFSKSVLYHL